MASPWQIVVSLIACSETNATIRILTESLLIQPLSFNSTTNHVVLGGFTIGVAIFALEIFALGVQLNAPFPLACNCTLSPRQSKVSRKPSVIGGLSIILIVLKTVSTQPLLFVTIRLISLGPIVV